MKHPDDELGDILLDLKNYLEFCKEMGVDRYYVNREMEATHEAEKTEAKELKSKPVSSKQDDSDIIVIEDQADIFEKAKAMNLEEIRQEIGDCTRCKLHEGRTNLVFGDGNPKARLVFVGEGPGRDEDLQGLPFVGRAGKLLTKIIEAMGLRREEVYICNVVKCRPPDNRTPEPDEMYTCEQFLFKQIRFINPEVIVCLGATAAKSILRTKASLGSLRGKFHMYSGARLMVTYHPAALLRNPNFRRPLWEDMQIVMKELGLELPDKKGD